MGIKDLSLSSKAVGNQGACYSNNGVCADEDKQNCQNNVELVNFHINGSYRVWEFTRPIAASDVCDRAIPTGAVRLSFSQTILIFSTEFGLRHCRCRYDERWYRFTIQHVTTQLSYFFGHLKHFPKRTNSSCKPNCDDYNDKYLNFWNV